MSEPIYFRSTTPRYRFLSNFYRVPGGMAAMDRVWPTVEHLYQALKVDPTHAEHDEWVERIHQVRTPVEAKRLGRLAPISPHLDPIEAMLGALLLKFVPGSGLAQRLIDTGDAPLIEDNPGPWGGQDNGENWMGACLEAIRDELQADPSTPWEGRSWGSST